MTRLSWGLVSTLDPRHPPSLYARRKKCASRSVTPADRRTIRPADPEGDSRGPSCWSYRCSFPEFPATRRTCRRSFAVELSLLCLQQLSQEWSGAGFEIEWTNRSSSSLLNSTKKTARRLPLRPLRRDDRDGGHGPPPTCWSCVGSDAVAFEHAADGILDRLEQ